MPAIKLIHFVAAAFMLVTGTFLCGAFVASIAIHKGANVELARVHGMVTHNGQPQTNLWVAFDPVEGGRGGEDLTDEEGHYDLAYTFEKRGAWLGRHHVRIRTGGLFDENGVESPQVLIYSCEVEVKGGENRIDFKLPTPPSPST